MCSLFDSPSLFHFFKPKLVSEIYKELRSELHSDGSNTLPQPVTELRVVVQRVLINIPHTTKETTTELNSCVTDTECDDELITCSSCGICVHRCEPKIMLVRIPVPLPEY